MTRQTVTRRRILSTCIQDFNSERGQYTRKRVEDHRPDPSCPFHPFFVSVSTWRCSGVYRSVVSSWGLLTDESVSLVLWFLPFLLHKMKIHNYRVEHFNYLAAYRLFNPTVEAKLQTVESPSLHLKPKSTAMRCTLLSDVRSRADLLSIRSRSPLCRGIGVSITLSSDIFKIVRTVCWGLSLAQLAG